MFPTLQFIVETAPTVHAAVPPAGQPVTLAAGEGVFDLVTGVFTDAQATLRVGSAVLGAGFVVQRAFATRMAIAAVLIAGLCAGIFVWIVFNVTDLSDRVDNEVDARAPSVSLVVAAPSLWPAAPLAVHRDDAPALLAAHS